MIFENLQNIGQKAFDYRNIDGNIRFGGLTNQSSPYPFHYAVINGNMEFPNLQTTNSKIFHRATIYVNLEFPELLYIPIPWPIPYIKINTTLLWDLG